MLDKLVDLLVQFFDLLLFVEVVDDYQGGVMLRFGRFHRELGPGPHGRIPFGVDRPLVTSVVPDASRLPTQIFTLKDGTTVAITPVLTYRVHNLRKALLEVEDAETSLHDATAGWIRRLLTPHAWADLVDAERCAEIELAVAKEIRSEAFRWGFEILRVQFPDLVKLRAAYQHFGVERVA